MSKLEQKDIEELCDGLDELDLDAEYDDEEEQLEPSIEELEDDEYWDNVLSPQVEYLNRR